MDTQWLIGLAVLALPLICMLFWWDYKTSGCAYGGSGAGKDNWLLTRLRERVREFRAHRNDREPRDVSDI